MTVLLVCALCSLLASVLGTDCPDTWVAFHGSCYKFARGATIHTHAEEYCRQHHESHLVQIETRYENQFIKTFLQDFDSEHLYFTQHANNYTNQREVLARSLQRLCGIPSLDTETLLIIEGHPEIDSWRITIQTELDSSFWLGMSDETIEDMWMWQATDSPVNFTDWLPSEPQNIHGNEDCAIMAFHSIFGWADVNCVSTSRPLCELSGGTSTNIIG